MSVLLAQAEMDWLEGHLVRLFDLGPVGPVAGAALLLASLGIGAAHALAPGHGKAIIAAYLVGQQGRPRDAVAFGSVVTFMHTASVLAIGVGIYLVTRAGAASGTFASVDAAAPWLTVVAGVLVLAVGVAMLVRVLRRRDHTHTLPAEVPPLSRRGLALLGTAGGLLPSPSAFLVLTTGLFTGRAAFALLLVAAFSLGLATTLTVLGLAVLWGRDRALQRISASAAAGRITRVVPVASATAVALGGAVVAGTALLRAL